MKTLSIDFQRVVLNLKRAGLSYKSIGDKCGVDAQHIGHYARGEAYIPRFDKAMLLLDLHYDNCPDRHNLKDLRIV